MNKNKYWWLNIFLGFVVLVLSLSILWLWRYLVVQIFVNGEQTDIDDGFTQIISEPIVIKTVPTATDNKLVQETSSTVLPPTTISPTPVATAIVEVENNNEEKPLATRVNLAVPFTSQAPEKNWSQPWQDACEEAAVLMLDAYYKKYGLSPLFAKDEMLKMLSWEEQRGWGLSIEMEKMKELTNWYMSASSKIIENPTIEEIKKFLANGRPVLAVVDGKELPNPHYRNGGPVYHALIIRGYSETQFITNDPGTQFGENYKYDYNDLMSSIHDWNGGNVKQGRRVVLVVE